MFMFKEIVANKIGTLLGFIVSSFLVIYHLRMSWLHGKKGMLLSIVSIIMSGGIITGGLITGFLIGRYLVNHQFKMFTVIGCILGSIAISPLSLYYSIILATLGGGIGEIIGRAIHLEKFGINFGIFISIILVFIIVEILGALIGGVIGNLIGNVINRFAS